MTKAARTLSLTTKLKGNPFEFQLEHNFGLTCRLKPYKTLKQIVSAFHSPFRVFNMLKNKAARTCEIKPK